ncbi:conserved unknown protein [Ectocarpus siliculosus]|uniref:Uncharacterized protein n=1 Tax=Ectocarpus siliculosus TaxID=2880 RepID=D8LAW8_ECTSI|nr:conserved unknown protein [Ectocarpus siliculosus]|eukprot:CBN76477.1 conserved unknown protein [Ectocarpus siliculosus]
MDQVELEIYRVHGLTEKTDNRGSFWIKFDLGYSKDEKIGKGFTQSYRADADSVDVDYKTSSYVKRARSSQMAFQNRRAGLEIFHKKNIVSGGKFDRQVPGPAAAASDHVRADVVHAYPGPKGGGRRAGTWSCRCGCEKELEVGEWPTVSLDEPVAQAPAPTPIAAPAPAPAPASVPVAQAPAAAGGGAGAAAAAQVQAAAKFQSVVLTDKEKTDPFGVENLDSNNVLEAEIEAIAPKAATGDLASVMRKGALETKLLMLVSAVQSGELDLPAYCNILKERVVRDKVLAMYLKDEKRTKEAVAVMKRIRAMEEELAGVPQEEEEDVEA